MSKLFKKSMLFSIPAILFLVIYIIVDPFKILHNYANYYSENGFYVTKEAKLYQVEDKQKE